jgi:hypothetical protein
MWPARKPCASLKRQRNFRDQWIPFAASLKQLPLLGAFCVSAMTSFPLAWSLNKTLKRKLHEYLPSTFRDTKF